MEIDTNILYYLNKILDYRKSTGYYRLWQFRNMITKLSNGDDPLDTYERRDAGIDDDEWNNVLNDFLSKIDRIDKGETCKK